MKKTLCIGLALVALALPAAAQAEDDHSQHSMPAAQNAADGAAKAYMDGMARMNRDMNAAMTGDADIDFAAMMIPHHQGAIDMAKTVQASGKDEEIKAMAQKMIDAQTKEIEQLTTWIEAHAAK